MLAGVQSGCMWNGSLVPIGGIECFVYIFTSNTIFCATTCMRHEILRCRQDLRYKWIALYFNTLHLSYSSYAVLSTGCLGMLFHCTADRKQSQRTRCSSLSHICTCLLNSFTLKKKLFFLQLFCFCFFVMCDFIQLELPAHLKRRRLRFFPLSRLCTKQVSIFVWRSATGSSMYT